VNWLDLHADNTDVAAVPAVEFEASVRDHYLAQLEWVGLLAG
jgi:hypothetical protein